MLYPGPRFLPMSTPPSDGVGRHGHWGKGTCPSDQVTYYSLPSQGPPEGPMRKHSFSGEGPLTMRPPKVQYGSLPQSLSDLPQHFKKSWPHRSRGGCSSLTFRLPRCFSGCLCRCLSLCPNCLVFVGPCSSQRKLSTTTSPCEPRVSGSTAQASCTHLPCGDDVGASASATASA